MSDDSPIALLRDLITVSDRLTQNPSGSDLERLVMRRAELIKDLLFYRYYGFRAPLIEELLNFDPGVQAVWEQIQKEEEQADVLARQFGEGSTGQANVAGMDKPHSRRSWSFDPDAFEDPLLD